MWVQCIRLKLTFSHGKLNANFGNFNFFQWRRPWSLEIYRLAKFITLIQTEFFQYLSRLCTYHWGIGSLKNNSAVSRSGYLYGVNQKCSLANAFFSLQKVQPEASCKILWWKMKTKVLLIFWSLSLNFL